jgi:2-polyprenyl-3-methyl-5-hydroxy-6-metoxy-1,4-benzoquinol methylase
MGIDYEKYDDSPEEYFDSIVFNDVLEHLHSPWYVLKRIKKLPKKNRYAMASIPNISYYDQITKLVLINE